MSHVTPTSKTLVEITRDWLRSAGKGWVWKHYVNDNLAPPPEMPGIPDPLMKEFTQFLKKCVVYEYPRPSVTVDLVIFGLEMASVKPTLKVLLIRRGHEPFAGHWAIPGGFVNENEDLGIAARLEAREETHAEPAYIEQLGTYGAPGRDPRGRVVSVAYMALASMDTIMVQADDDADDARWFPVNDLPKNLAFDHDAILGDALKRLRSKLRWQPIGIDLLPETFTIDDLRRVYEAVLDRPLDRRNFAKKVLGYEVLESAESVRIGGTGRPPRLWRFDRTAYETLIEEGAEFKV